MKSFLHILRAVAASAVLLTLAAGAAAQSRAATTPPTRQIFVYPANHGAICRSDAGVNVVSSGSLRGYKQDSDEEITTGSLQTLSFSGLRIQKLQLYVLENGGELGAPIDSIWADAGRAAFRTDDANRSTGVSNGGFFGPQRGSSAPIRYSFNAPADQTVIFGGRSERWGSPATSHVQVRNNTALSLLAIYAGDLLMQEYQGKTLMVRIWTGNDVDLTKERTTTTQHIDILFDPIGGYYSDVVRTEIDDDDAKWVLDEDEQAFVQAPCKDDKPEMKIKNSDNPYRDGETPLVSKLGNTYSAKYSWRLDRDTWSTASAGQEKQQDSKSYIDQDITSQSTSGQRFYTPVMKFHVANNGGAQEAVPQCELSLDHQFQVYYFTALKMEGKFTNKTSNATKSTTGANGTTPAAPMEFTVCQGDEVEFSPSFRQSVVNTTNSGATEPTLTADVRWSLYEVVNDGETRTETLIFKDRDWSQGGEGASYSFGPLQDDKEYRVVAEYVDPDGHSQGALVAEGKKEANDCPTEQTIKITVKKTNATSTITVSDQVCEGSSVSLSASFTLNGGETASGYAYRWQKSTDGATFTALPSGSDAWTDVNGGGTTASTTDANVSRPAAGSVWYKFQLGNKVEIDGKSYYCPAETVKQVTVNARPKLEVGGGSSPLCEGRNMSLALRLTAGFDQGQTVEYTLYEDEACKNEVNVNGLDANFKAKQTVSAATARWTLPGAWLLARGTSGTATLYAKAKNTTTSCESESLKVEVKLLPNPFVETLTLSPDKVCQGAEATVSATATISQTTYNETKIKDAGKQWPTNLTFHWDVAGASSTSTATSATNPHTHQLTIPTTAAGTQTVKVWVSDDNGCGYKYDAEGKQLNEPYTDAKTATVEVVEPPKFTVQSGVQACATAGQVKVTLTSQDSKKLTFAVKPKGGATATVAPTAVEANQSADITVSFGPDQVSGVTTFSFDVTATHEDEPKCGATQEFTITVYPNPSLSLTPAEGEGRRVCAGSPIVLGAVATVPGLDAAAANFTYKWTVDSQEQTGAAGPNFTWTPGADAAGQKKTVSVEVSYAFDGAQSCSVSQQMEIEVLPLPVVTLTAADPQPICQGQSATLTATVTSEGAAQQGGTSTQTFTYNISPSADGTPGTDGKSWTFTVSPNRTATYSLTVTNTQTGCVSAPATAQVTVDVVDFALASDDGKAGDPMVYCVGDALNLRTAETLTDNYAYQWSKDGVVVENETGREFKIASLQTTDGGTYSLRVTKDGRCSAEREVKIEVRQAPVPTLVMTDAAGANVAPLEPSEEGKWKFKVCEDEAFTLTPGGATTYTLTKFERGKTDITAQFTLLTFTGGSLSTSLPHVAEAGAEAGHTVYSLSLSFATGDCVETRTVEISVYDKPDAAFLDGTPQRFVVKGEGVQVSVTSGFKKYSFYVGGVLKQEGESSTLAAEQNVVDAEGQVEVRVVVENEAGCQATIETTITALDGIVPRTVTVSSDFYCTDAPGVTIAVSNPQPGLVYILDGVASAGAITSAAGQPVEWTGVRLTDPTNQNPQTFKVRAYYAQLPDKAVDMANTVTVEEVASPPAATMPTQTANDCATIGQTTWIVPTTSASAYYFVKFGDDLFPAEGVQGSGGALTLQFFQLAAAQYGAPRNGEYKVVARAKRKDGSFACEKELGGALTVDIPQTDAYGLSVYPQTDFCVGNVADFSITLAGSDFSPEYEHVYVLRRNGEEVARRTSTAARGPIVFTDAQASTLAAGEYTYTVVCLFSGCEMPMLGNVSIRLFSQPRKLDVELENDGFYCPDENGVSLTVRGAESGVTYALTDKRTRQVVQESVVWAGSELTFEGVEAGTYYVEAYIATVGNGCRTVFDDIVVTRIDEPSPIVATISKVGQAGRGGRELTLCVDEEWQVHVAGADFSPNSPIQRSYALYGQDNTLVSNEMQGVDQRNGTFSFPATKAQTPGTFTFSVIAKATVTLKDGKQLECQTEFEQVVTLTVKSRPKTSETVKTETPQGQTDPCYGVDIVIESPNADAQATVEYRLFKADGGATRWNGQTPIATVRPYAGDAPRFANIRDNGGTYAVVASNGACEELIGTVTVSSDKFPKVQELDFEGYMCEGEPGKPVSLADSESGVSYTLHYVSPDLYAQLAASGGLTPASLADSKPGRKLTADAVSATYDHQRLTFRGLKYSDDGVPTDLVNVDGYYYVVATKPAQEGQGQGCPVASPLVNFQTLKLPLSFNLEKSNIFCQGDGSTDVYVENAEYDPDGVITYSLYKVDDRGNATLFDQVRSNANTAGRLYFGRAVPEGDYYAIVFKQYGDQYGGHVCSSRLRGDLRLRKAPPLDNLTIGDEGRDICHGDAGGDAWTPDNARLAQALQAGKQAQSALTGIRLFVTLDGESPERPEAIIAQALYDGTTDVSFADLPVGNMLVWASWASEDPADDLACLVNIGSISRRPPIPAGLDAVACDGTLTLEGEYVVVGLTYQLVDNATNQVVATTTVDAEGVTAVRLSNLRRGVYTLYAGFDGGEKCRAEVGRLTVSGAAVAPVEVEMAVCDANGLVYEVPLGLLVEGANYHLSTRAELPIDFAAEYYQYLGKTADGCLTVSGLRCGTNYLWMGFGENFDCPQIVATITVNCQSLLDLQDANFGYVGGGCSGEPLALVLDRSQEGVGYHLTVGDSQDAIAGTEQEGTGEALTWPAQTLPVKTGTATYHLWARLLNPTDDDCTSGNAWKQLTIDFDQVLLPVGHLVAPDSIFEYCEGDLGVRLGYARSPRVGEVYRLYRRRTAEEQQDPRNPWDRELVDMQEIPSYMREVEELSSEAKRYTEADTLFFDGWGHNESTRHYATAGVYFVEVADEQGCRRVTEDREVRELPLPVANDSVYSVVFDADGVRNDETASREYGIFGYSIVVAGAKAGVSYTLVKDDTTLVKQVVPQADGDVVFGPLRDLKADTVAGGENPVVEFRMDVTGDTLYVGEGVYTVVVRDPETQCDNTVGRITIVAEDLVAYNVQIFLGKSDLGKTVDLIPAYEFDANISHKGDQRYIGWSSSIDRVYRPKVNEADEGYILDEAGTKELNEEDNGSYFGNGYSNVAGSFDQRTGRFNARDEKAANVWFRLLPDSTQKIAGSYGLLDISNGNTLSDQTQTGYFSYIKQPSFYGQEQIRYLIENKQMPGRVSNIATITILAGNEDVGDDESVFLIPNAFSPNGDGLNDVFKIIIPDKYKTNSESKLQVFNRWGTLVYRSSGQQYGDNESWWDGKSSTSNMVTLGQNLPSGTYYYVFTITFINQRTVTRSTRKMSGYVELRR